jgi:predicted DsbA family dithiol-disulfide isomerase
MMMAKRVALVSGLLSVALTACHPAAAGKAAAAKSGAETAGGPVVANVNGSSITLDEVDFRAAGRLAQARQEEYEARVEAARLLITERLIAVEAKKRNMSSAMLVRAEVDEKVEAPTAKELDATYEANKARFQGQSRQQAMATIEKLVKDQRRSTREAAFRGALLDKAAVKIDLVPPRHDMASLAGAPSQGPADAKVTLIEFTDYQCPYCRRAEQTVTTILEEYETRVRFIHADFPLSFHDRALVAARASRCAGDQGKFFSYRHDLLVSPGDLSDADLEKRASGLGLDGESFTSCIQSERHDAAIQAMADQAERFGVNATPTFFVNGRKLTGAASVDEFKRILDEELARAGG